MHKILSRSSKIGVWWELSRKQIVGPPFFEETINAESYPHLLAKLIAVLEDNERNWWLQLDGQIAHPEKTTAFLQNFFGDRIAGRSFGGHDHQTFTLPDFFLCGFRKESVYSNKQISVEDPEHNNEQAVAGAGK